MRRSCGSFLLCAIVVLAHAAVAGAAGPWPPVEGPGHLFAHYGEEHWNDADGLTLLPKVAEDTARYRPALVTMSGDKDNDGTVGQLSRWRQIMEVYDRAGIPYFPAVGNHDRLTPPGAPAGSTPVGDFSNYRQVFADRPYPFGDAAPYPGPMLGPTERPAGDPPGASSHYYVDYANVRWIFLDNSCYSIVNCDPLQNPPDDSGDTQYEFLERHAGAAREAGRHVFVVMHMPTQDPRDQSYADPISVMHTMGKGISPDNDELERRAEALGVDAVFAGHIKGQWQYRGRGDIPYYIDGGAGGELYTTGPVGVDHGYWHGYRLIRVDGDRVTTDVVPIFVEGGITVRGPERLAPGESAGFEAFGRQPVFNDPAKVEALELRDPDPVPEQGRGLQLGPGFLFLLPPLAIALAALASRIELPRTRPALAAPALALVALGGLVAVAAAQRGEPTSTPKEALPNPARIWTSSHPLVLEPAASNSEDPRRDPRTQTQDGAFRARCPGRARVSIRSGWAAAARSVTVPSREGTIVRSIRFAQRRRAVRLRLAQPARVTVRVVRRKRVVRTLRHECAGAGPLRARWNGSREGGRRARPGRYRLRVTVKSDRKPVMRSTVLHVR
jgi:Calcineurin-like phosphoesterase